MQSKATSHSPLDGADGDRHGDDEHVLGDVHQLPRTRVAELLERTRTRRGRPDHVDGVQDQVIKSEAEAEGAANGFVHYGGDVYCKSTRRAGSDAFDLTFHLFDQNGQYYHFKDCDATGKFAPGKTQYILRSKVAVARYLARDCGSAAANFSAAAWAGA